MFTLLLLFAGVVVALSLLMTSAWAFDAFEPLYSADVIATTSPNVLTTPTQLNLNKPHMSTQQNREPMYEATSDSMIVGPKITPTSARVNTVMAALQAAIMAAQREGCKRAPPMFKALKEETLYKLTASPTGVTCAELKQTVLSTMKERHVPPSLEVPILDVWDAIAKEVCDVNGFVQPKHVDLYMSEVFKSICPQ